MPQDATIGAGGAISAQHTYAAPGVYTAHVTVWDARSSTTLPFTVTVTGTSAAQARVTTLAPPPAAISVPGLKPQVTLSATEGPRGTALTLDASGFARNETVTITFGGLTTLTVRANADGIVSAASFSVPGSAAVPGSTGIQLAGAASGIRVEVPFTVTY